MSLQPTFSFTVQQQHLIEFQLQSVWHEILQDQAPEDLRVLAATRCLADNAQMTHQGTEITVYSYLAN